MFRVKTAIFYQVGLFMLFYCVNISAQEHKVDFNEILNRAYSFQNINSDSIVHYANDAYFAGIDLQNPEMQIDAIKLIVNAQLKAGKYSQAFIWCQTADSISRTNDLFEKGLEIKMYKGLVFQSSGFVSEGLDIFLNAQRKIDERGEGEIEADLTYYIALAYYNIVEIEQCRNYARKALAIEQKRSNKPGMIKNYLLLANTFNQVDSIQKYLSLTDNLVDNGEMEFKKAAVLNSKALLYKALGDFQTSKKAYMEAIYISISHGYKDHLSNLYNNYAYLLMEEKKFDSVDIVLKKALFLARDLNNIDLEASIMDSYSDYYTAIGDSALSYKYYRSSIALKNQYRQKQQIEKAMFLSTVFETEKKEKEIATQESKLYQINTILFAVLALFSATVAILIYFRQKSAARKTQINTMAQEAKLEVANALIEGQDAERKRLAMDLHDGIGPRIGMLKMTIDSNFEKSINHDEIVESITEIGRNIRDISHRMLPPQLESHGLSKALENLILLSERNSDIKFIFYTNLNERLIYKLEVNLFYLSSEIINNAIKHSKGTEINIQLLSDQKSVSLSVEDDGIGFNSNSDYNGLGLKNIRQRVNYLGGNLTMDSEIGQGTAIIIEVKL